MAGDRVIQVEGLQRLSRAFAVMDKTLSSDLRTALRTAAEPVRSDAELLAVARIRRIGTPWSRMRVGVTRTSVYVAPRQRGASSRADMRRRRPNLKGLLLGRAMQPALDANIPAVERAVEDVLLDASRAWGRAR